MSVDEPVEKIVESESFEEKFEEIALEVSASDKRKTILERWDITIEELTELVDDNGSLRGIMQGYVAERKLRKQLDEEGRLKYLGKHDDHDRKKKGDLQVEYEATEFDLEVKSLQAKQNWLDEETGVWYGKAQVDGSDRRIITLPDGSKMETTNLIYNEFDILAVSIFAFEGEWKFLYAKNKDLPHSTWHKYTPQQQEALIASLIPLSYPPQPGSIFTEDLYGLMDELKAEWERDGRPPRPVYEKKKKSKKAKPAAAADAGAATPVKRTRRRKAAPEPSLPLGGEAGGELPLS